MSMIGKTLAHYEITSQLGKGGMGEVYQAKDRKLGRDVAIKVLPEEFARNADRIARFQREAKLLASLNHPNIAAIHGLEESGGTNFLVLELVEGETLADRIKAGPVPVEESLKLALQIAEALEAAHEKGVIHRDLKPANIKVTPEGKVKVLDFGLAKAYAGEKEEVNLSNSPTLSDAATKQGVILGTAAYMSPEQARGETVDKRADIWAFGVVLFEMLTGRGMFESRTVSDTLAAVLMREPEWMRLPVNPHPRIRLLLERCLEKDAKNRYHDIADVRVDIQKVLADPSGAPVQPAGAIWPRRKLRTILPWTAAALVFGLIIAGVAVWKLKPSDSRQVMRFEYYLPEGHRETGLAVSRDGKQFVYSTAKGLYLRSMEEFAVKLIPGTEENIQRPFFSPDSKWIGYFSVSDQKLKKIPVGGGEPVILCDAAQLAGAKWNEDSTIVFCEFPKGDIMQVSANGGTAESILKAKSSISIINPQILPGGKSVLYSSYADALQSRIMVQSLKSGETKQLFPGVIAQYLSTGHIVFSLQGNSNLFAVPFDLARLEVTEGPVAVVTNINLMDISQTGTLVYSAPVAPAAQARRELVWVNRQGKEEPIAAQPDAYYSGLKISPDGTRLALAVGTNLESDIWIWNFVRKTMTRLTFDKGEDALPVWSPDSKRIAFHTHKKNARGSLYSRAADGTGEDEAIGSFLGKEVFPWSWSSDGKNLFVQAGVRSATDIEVLSIEGERKYRVLLKETYAQMQPKISPDGRWLAYTSDESGQMQIYVRPFPDVNKGKWQISANGGSSPLWSRDGRELFYCGSDAVIAVPVRTEPAFYFETGKVLFQGKYSADWSGRVWDISSDGKRFLMMKEAATIATPAAAEAPRKINIVLNWFEELKQRVPTK
jgi:eukaryotic-like serine/threonine-protein kinase